MNLLGRRNGELQSGRPLSGNGSLADADMAAGSKSIEMAPLSLGGLPSHPSDLEFFDDLVSEPVLVLGMDISHLSTQNQFLVCASGVFGFSLLYGYLQELISVQIANRQLGLFLAMMQFTGYSVLSFLLRRYVYERHERRIEDKRKVRQHRHVSLDVPIAMYLGLSLLRAIDLAMTNLAMQYINYPAKTLMKSSRVVFTMLFGVLIAKKRYRLVDYLVVVCMVFGLAIFMHADANSSAVFEPIGVFMLTISLLCDGAITNMSEKIMRNYGVGQDEFIFKMYSIALVAITLAAFVKGDLKEGVIWILQPGTFKEIQTNAEPTWSVSGKIMVTLLFSSMGFVGSSFSAAITKNFGALTMSITSTARKATTLFLSFFLFNNVCTMEHLAGVVIFISALTTKTLRRRNDSYSKNPSVSEAKMSPGVGIAMGGNSMDSSSGSTGRTGRSKSGLIRPFSRGTKVTTPTKRNRKVATSEKVQVQPLLAKPGSGHVESHAIIV